MAKWAPRRELFNTILERTNIMHMGKAIRQTREAKGVTLTRLAMDTGYKVSAIGKIELKPFLFNLEPLYVISDALGVKMSQLIQKAEEL
jgi:transcriptional regulator with XRE-family HTH domain